MHPAEGYRGQSPTFSAWCCSWKRPLPSNKWVEYQTHWPWLRQVNNRKFLTTVPICPCYHPNWANQAQSMATNLPNCAEFSNENMVWPANITQWRQCLKRHQVIELMGSCYRGLRHWNHRPFPSRFSRCFHFIWAPCSCTMSTFRPRLSVPSK